MQLTYDEIIIIADQKTIPSKIIGYSLQPGTYKISNLNETLVYILPDNAKVTTTFDDMRL